MKSGDMICKKFVTDSTDSARISGIIIEVYDWNAIVLWSDGSKWECIKSELEMLYNVISP